MNHKENEFPDYLDLTLLGIGLFIFSILCLFGGIQP